MAVSVIGDPVCGCPDTKGPTFGVYMMVPNLGLRTPQQGGWLVAPVSQTLPMDMEGGTINGPKPRGAVGAA